MTHLMPPPYQTNCLNYSKIGCKSRSDCINKCKIEISLKQCNELPFDVNVDRNNDKDTYNVSKCYFELDESVCHDKYKSPDCINEYFSFKPFSDSALNESWISKIILENYLSNKTNRFNALTSVLIDFGDEPDTIYTHSPQQHLVEFLSFIGGMISLWTGFSVLSLYGFWKRFFVSENQSKEKKLFKKNNKINFVNSDTVKPVMTIDRITQSQNSKIEYTVRKAFPLRYIRKRLSF